MKKRDFLSWLVTPTGIKGCASHVGAGCTFCPGCQTRDKRAPLLSRTGVPGWETGTTAVSQPGQINVFVVVGSASNYHQRNTQTGNATTSTVSTNPAEEQIMQESVNRLIIPVLETGSEQSHAHAPLSLRVFGYTRLRRKHYSIPGRLYFRPSAEFRSYPVENCDSIISFRVRAESWSSVRCHQCIHSLACSRKKAFMHLLADGRKQLRCSRIGGGRSRRTA